MYRLDSINLFPMPYIDLLYIAFYYSQSRLTLVCSWSYHRTASPNFQIWCSKWSDQHVSYADLSRIAMDAKTSPSRRQTSTPFTHTMSRKETSSIPLRHHKQIPKPHKKKTSSTPRLWRPATFRSRPRMLASGVNTCLKLGACMMLFLFLTPISSYRVL